MSESTPIQNKSDYKLYVHGSIPEYQFDGDDKDKKYLPARAAIYAVNSPETMVFLPDSEEVKDFIDDFKQVIYDVFSSSSVPMNFEYIDQEPETYLLDVAINQSFRDYQERIKDWAGDEKVNVEPYSNTYDLRKWVSKMDRSDLDISINIPERVYFDDLDSVQHRGGWSRDINTPNEPSLPEKFGIKYPISYKINNREDAIKAFEAISNETGKADAFFKPVFSSGGYTIKRIESVEDIDAAYKNMENNNLDTLFDRRMPIEIQQTLDIEEQYSFQYQNGEVITPNLLSQQLGEIKWEGNVFNTFGNGLLAQTGELIRNIERMSKETDEFFEFGIGGFDLAESNGELFVIEHNGGRPTGAFPAIHAANLFGVAHKPFLMRKALDIDAPLKDVWAKLKESGLAYNQNTKSGIFPISWLEGSRQLFIVGENADELDERFEQFNSLFK